MSDRAGGISQAAMEQILEVTRQLAAPFTLYAMLNSVIDAGRSVLGADRGSVFLYDAETDELVISVGTGVQSIRIPADRGIAGECAQTREVINVPDCYADSRFDPSTDNHIHSATLEHPAPDQLVSRWTGWAAGQEAGKMIFHLARADAE